VWLGNWGQVRQKISKMNTQYRNEEAESAARQALEAFITAWNTGDDAQLRTTMHFPFVTFGGGSRVFVNKAPEDFSAGFDEMRKQEGWASSSLCRQGT